MRRFWAHKVTEHEQAAKESEARREATASDWAVIREEVLKGRKHREQNHIMDLIINVARGSHS